MQQAAMGSEEKSKIHALRYIRKDFHKPFNSYTLTYAPLSSKKIIIYLIIQVKSAQSVRRWREKKKHGNDTTLEHKKQKYRTINHSECIYTCILPHIDVIYVKQSACKRLYINPTSIFLIQCEVVRFTQI